MDLYGNDMILGNFKLSDHNMMLAAFGSPEDEVDLGMDYEVVEEYVGYNPVPTYLGAKYTSKLTPQATIIKNPCLDGVGYFTEHECREVLRELTGFPGYKKLEILSDAMEDYYYFNARVNRASYYKSGSKVVGIILGMECDSQFAWSKDFTLTYPLFAGEELVFYNQSDDRYNYLLPTITLYSEQGVDELVLTSVRDNNRETIFTNVSAGETLTMNSQLNLLSSSIPGKIPLNDFNMCFLRLVPDQNIIKVSHDVTITLQYKLPRKVGFL